MKTHYDTLGVPFGADYETIRKAYRQALKVYHPDLHEGNAAAELHSKRIIDAHAALKDPEERAEYDEWVRHRKLQRRRLFLITLLVSTVFVCGGSLVVLRWLSPEAKAVASSDRSISVAVSVPVPAGRPERAARTENRPAPAAPTRHDMGAAPSLATVPPMPPKRPAELATLVPAAVARTPSEIGDATYFVSPAPETVLQVAATAFAQVTVPAATAPAASGMDDAPSPAMPAPSPMRSLPEPSPAERAASPVAEPSPAAVDHAPSNATIAPAPPADLPEPVLEVAAPAPADAPPPAAAEPSPSEPADAPSDAAMAPAPPPVLAQPAPEVTAAAQLRTAWAGIAERANVEEIWSFIQEYPGTPEAALAEIRLGELIDTNDDAASLVMLRASATGPIALKLQARLDKLAGAKDTTGALPDESAEAPQPEAPPAPVATVTPDQAPPQDPAADPTADITPRDPKEHVKRGVASLKAGKHDRAIASFDKAIRLEPTNARYHVHRAAAWEGNGDLDKALADYNTAIALDRTSITTFHARGLLWRRRGDVERALDDLDQAIRLSFSDPRIYRDRGMIWFEMGRYNRAIADFSRAIALNPNFAGAYVNRGHAFAKKGDLTTAEVNFDKAAQRDPTIGKVDRDVFRVYPDTTPVKKASR
jgi:tetratricopeptide (TPR) repeat protein